MQRFSFLIVLCLICVSPLLAEAEVPYDLSDPAEPWRTSNSGVTTEVPAPFEPLMTGSKVSMWGRTYELGGLFPVQITNQGKTVFVEAPKLILVTSQGRFETTGGKPSIGLTRADRVEFSSKTTLGPATVTANCWVEYDGVARIDFTLSTAAPVKVQQLIVEFALNADVAKFLHCHTQWGQATNMALPDEDGFTKSYGWRAFWWIGDHDRGLTIFTENNFDWTDPNPKAVTLVRSRKPDQPARQIVRFTIWSEPTTLKKDTTFTFGIHATPSKPLPDDWHGRHTGFLEDPETVRVSTIWHGSEKYYSYPEPESVEAFTELLTRSRKFGIRRTPYFSPTGAAPESDVCKRHRDEWIMTTAGGKPCWEGDKVDGADHGMVSACPASSFADFLTYGIEKMIAHYDIAGVYLDNATPYPCQNAAHGCGCNGKPSYPVFAYRDVVKRIYTIVRKARGDEGIVWKHNSRYIVSPQLSFVDIYSDGEQFRNPKTDRHAIPIESIDEAFRAMTFTGVQWGAQPAFLPSMNSGRVWLTNWCIAVTLPYGNVVQPAPGWMDYTAYGGLLKARLDFGLGREPVRWYRPHDLPAWLESGGDLIVGAYVRKKDNHILITAGNSGDKPATLSLHPARVAHLLGPNIKVTDAISGIATMRETSNEMLRMAIPASSCRMFYVYPLRAKSNE